ncbi:MAG TPA: 2-hydroxychromene-2-carboxylate isomerase [Noviherbaspirillum sp.]|jgi:2-hydroxychromene-2-carboxylate isomerase|uniref:2-hydroxychromene-2-carboxylate isomerase n=1 Tax=Noviherbaspirillum sp. TaxID=1926288 RepID=UPI002F93BDA7
MSGKKTIDWYFDFISPFSYLQAELLHTLPADTELRYRPVLLAGLLDHWDNKGPAEIAPKRTWTFEHCAWLAHRQGIPITMPGHHPFNPLPLLRLFIAAGGSAQAMRRIFHFVWREGRLPTDEAPFRALLQELRVTPEMLGSDEVKQALRRNGEAAIAAGVFGVPTAVVDNRCFWGLDATDMLQAWLRGDPFFQSSAFLGAQTLPPGIQRKK